MALLGWWSAVAVPKYERGGGDRPSGRIPRAVALDPLVTELRVHGVGGTTPETLLDDLAPEQVGGNRLAGFYRTADLRDGDRVRHVEAYSWGGLTSRSGVRVLWLVLLPFLLANLAGWMYRGDTVAGRPGGLHFRCHRVVCAVACLALTVNAVLALVLIAPNLLAYQASRAHVTHHWWLWPLSWTWVAGHGERPLVIGYAVVAVVIVLLAVLGYNTQDRYEAVRPPWRVTADGLGAGNETRAPDRSPTSAADRDLTDERFWDCALAVRRLTSAHLATAFGFLAVTFAVTAKAATGGPVAGLAWWWAATVLGGGALAVSVVIVVADQWADRIGWLALADRNVRIGLQAVAVAGAVCATVFAFLQPAMAAAPGSLPGLNRITAATYLAVGSTVVLMLLVGALGLVRRRSRPDGFVGAPVVVLTVAAGLLNSMLLGLLFALGNLAGRFRADPAPAGSLVVPAQIAWAGPVLGASYVAAIVLFGGPLVVRMLTGWGTTAPGFAADLRAYGEALRTDWPSTTPDRTWVVSEVQAAGPGPAPALDDPAERTAWRRKLWRAYWTANLRSLAGPLLYLIAGLQVAAVLVIVILRPGVPDAGYSPSGAFGTIAVTAATVLFATLLSLVRSGWRDSTERKRICVLWDVGTFWPRAYHPLAPPSYAERAVPDLQRRIWRLNDNGSPVLLVAHSQGAVLADAALAQQNCRAACGHIALASFGSPVSHLYGWGFPAYFNAQLLPAVFERRPDRAQVIRWRNFYYPTDPIGGPITGDEAPDARPRDTRLLDPPVAWHIYGDPAPSPGGHSGYWTDHRVWCAIDELADELRDCHLPAR